MDTKEYRLTDVCDFQGGTQPPKEEWINEPREGYVRMLQIRDFTQDKAEHIGYVKDTKKLNKCNANDILIGRYGASVGKILTGLSGAYNVAIIKTIPNEKLLSKKYLYYILAGTAFQNFILTIGARAAQAGFNKEDLSYFKFQLPTSLDDQNKIVQVLEKSKALLNDRQKSLKLIDEFLRMIFLEIFGDPIANNKGWKKEKLGDSINVKHGFAFQSEFFSEKGEFILLTPGNFHEEGGFKDRGDKQKYYIGNIPKGYILEKDAILIAMTEQAPGLLGTPIIVPSSNRYLHNQRLGLLIYSKEEFNTFFLFYLFSNSRIKQVIHKTATGMKVRHSSPSKIEDLDIYIPPINIQNQFALIVQQAAMYKDECVKSLSELENLFKSLSQQALIGKLKLTEAGLKIEPNVTDEVVVIDKINKELTEFHKSQSHTGAPAEIDNNIRKLEAELQIRGEIPFWDEYVRYKIVKGKFKDAFSFDQLWQEIIKFPFETVPEYDEVASMIFKWLEEEKLFLKQNFNREKNQIELIVNETTQA